MVIPDRRMPMMIREVSVVVSSCRLLSRPKKIKKQPDTIGIKFELFKPTDPAYGDGLTVA